MYFAKQEIHKLGHITSIDEDVLKFCLCADKTTDKSRVQNVPLDIVPRYVKTGLAHLLVFRVLLIRDRV